MAAILAAKNTTKHFDNLRYRLADELAVIMTGGKPPCDCRCVQRGCAKRCPQYWQ